MARYRRFHLAWLAGHLAGLALLAPASVLAADPPTIGGSPGTATLLVILLLGSLTAGIFFASPLRGHLGGRVSIDSTARPTPSDPRSHRLSGVDAALRRLRPLAAVLARAQLVADGWLDAAGEAIASRGRRLAPPPPGVPLPPMLGGDIFFDDGPPGGDPAGGDLAGGNLAGGHLAGGDLAAIPAALSEGTGQESSAASDWSAAGPWSTASPSDDRYWPSS